MLAGKILTLEAALSELDHNLSCWVSTWTRVLHHRAACWTRGPWCLLRVGKRRQRDFVFRASLKESSHSPKNKLSENRVTAPSPLPQVLIQVFPMETCGNVNRRWITLRKSVFPSSGSIFEFWLVSDRSQWDCPYRGTVADGVLIAPTSGPVSVWLSNENLSSWSLPTRTCWGESTAFHLKFHSWSRGQPTLELSCPH